MFAPPVVAADGTRILAIQAGRVMGVRAGAASIEHGILLNEEALQLMKQHGTFLVPTIYIHEFIMTQGSPGDIRRSIWRKNASQEKMKVFRRALDLGLRIASGTDVAVCPHGENGRQLAVMLEYGMGPLAAIQSANIHAAKMGVGATAPAPSKPASGPSSWPSGRMCLKISAHSRM